MPLKLEYTLDTVVRWEHRTILSPPSPFSLRPETIAGTLVSSGHEHEILALRATSFTLLPSQNDLEFVVERRVVDVEHVVLNTSGKWLGIFAPSINHTNRPPNPVRDKRD